MTLDLGLIIPKHLINLQVKYLKVIIIIDLGLNEKTVYPILKNKLLLLKS